MDLPLSWIYTNTNEIIALNKLDRKTNWSALIKTNNFNIADQLNKIDKSKNQIIRGCSEVTSEQLCTNGYHKYLSGYEAVLEFNSNHFNKPSLKSLIKRGSKHGIVKEVFISVQTIAKLKLLKNRTRYSNQPKLKNLFIDEFLKDTRLFVLENKNEWLAAIQISENSAYKFHTELLLRDSQSPVGTMEYLIHEVYNSLSNESKSVLSLGEVPFITFNNRHGYSAKEIMIRSFGQLGSFGYNYQGLYNFKNKFNPKWEKVYLCSKRELRLKDLFNLSVQSNYIRLLLNNFFS